MDFLRFVNNAWFYMGLFMYFWACLDFGFESDDDFK